MLDTSINCLRICDKYKSIIGTTIEVSGIEFTITGTTTFPIGGLDAYVSAVQTNAELGKFDFDPPIFSPYVIFAHGENILNCEMETLFAQLNLPFDKN